MTARFALTQLAWAASASLLTLPAAAQFDAIRVRFAQNTELGYLNPDRSVTGVGA